MPIAPGEHAEVLRALGRLLDAEFAEGIELVNYDAALTLSWRKKGLGAEQRNYQEHNLEELRKFATQSRGTYRGDRVDSLAEMLRTMGQDLDREKWKLTRISQESDGFLIEGWVGGREISRKYTYAELMASSKRRRDWRHTEATIEPTAPISRFEPQPKPGERVRSQTWGAEEERGPLARRLSAETDRGPLAKRLSK